MGSRLQTEMIFSQPDSEAKAEQQTVFFLITADTIL